VGVAKRRVLQGLWRRLVGVGIIGPGLLGAPAFILSLAALFWNPSLAQPSLCAPSALRGTSGGETMTTPGGAGTLCKPTDNFLRARRIGFYHGVGAPTSGPSSYPRAIWLTWGMRLPLYGGMMPAGNGNEKRRHIELCACLCS
jgi:hypothetical protein